MLRPRSKIKFTYQDYKNAPDDKRYELLEGDLVLAPSPSESHQRVAIALASRLLRFVTDAQLGRVYAAPFDVVLSDTDVVQPDVLFISQQRAQIITEDNVQGAPDLVIEILSPGSADRDRTFKRALYARHGVREYWLVDTDAEKVEVLTLGEQGLEPVAAYTQGQTMASPLLEGFRLNLSEVF